MTDEPKVVQLRKGPPLSDIPGHLRKLADAIEGGAYQDVRSMLGIMPVDGDYPILFGWGDVNGGNDPIIQCELAKAWFIKQRTGG